MGRLSIGYVLGTTAGGTGRHVAMLAGGCSGAGMTVTVYGPAGIARFFPQAPGPGAGRPPPVPASGDVLPQASGPEAARPPEGGQPAARPSSTLAGGTLSFVPVAMSSRARPARDAAAVLRLRRLLTRPPHDVVHAHGLRAGALTALALAGIRGRPPLLVTVHNAPPDGRVNAWVYGLLEWIVARRADAVTCVSGDLAARMARRGVSTVGRAVVSALPAPAPSPADVAAARAALGGGERHIVLAVGRLAPQKGFGTLLSAAAHWQRRDPAPLAAVAGDGPLAGPLRAEVGRRGLDVRFLGERDDVPALLAAADVVVVPSRWEGQPLIVQEALRAGRPIVATRAGGIPDLTGEDGALLVPPGDAGRLASAVLAVLDDPRLAARLAAAARSRAARLPTAAGAVAASMAAYERLVTGPEPSHRPGSSWPGRGGSLPRGR